MKSLKNKNLRTICEGAVCVAMAVVLNFFRMPTDWMAGTGGSVELTMIPLIVFALRRGAGWGVGAGLIFGVLKCIIGGGIAYGWQALLLDYAVAFAVVGLAGLFPRQKGLGAFVGAAARFLAHVISGVVIWGQWMPEEFLGLYMANVWEYSILYNGFYMVVNSVLCVMVIVLLARSSQLLERQCAEA